MTADPEYVVSVETIRGNGRLLKELTPLIQANYAEVGFFKDTDLAIAFEHYQQAEASGMWKLYTLRRREKLIGFASFFVTMAMHNVRTKRATHDALYVVPEYRRADMVRNFIFTIDAELEESGADVVVQSVPVVKDFGPMLESMGYERMATTYGRKLKGGHLNG